ncbi:la-related protein Larp4B-like [Aricia agestis]|uniref:la-related protein Larp4B-like n=1 Tax=Aricia agestis TaxID=91739 RepID=UPI001C2020AB|nr:la-related protein Larp4B-like [Aricia agestis]
MEFIKCLTVLVVFFADIDAGGHEKHHDHVKVHLPEFIHHDHHTKVITIHHHHHKPKEHHHHHHHHHKPHGHGHHYHHKKSSTHHVSKGHSSGHGHSGHHHGHHHGHQGHHHGHHGHHQGHHGHHGHEHKHHDPTPTFNYNPPTVNYDPPTVNYDSPYTPFTSSIPNIPHAPKVHGVVHTVKQVKVFDSLPGAVPGAGLAGTGTGYQVTEEGSDHEDDVFTSVNTLPQSFSGTFGFVRNAAPAQEDPFADIPQQSTAQVQNHDPFASPQPTSYDNLENFSQNDPFSSVAPTAGGLPTAASSFRSDAEFDGNGGNINAFDDPSNIIVGNDIGSTAFLSDGGNDDSPVSFSREAGIQQTIKTGGVETLVY